MALVHSNLRYRLTRPSHAPLSQLRFSHRFSAHHSHLICFPPPICRLWRPLVHCDGGSPIRRPPKEALHSLPSFLRPTRASIRKLLLTSPASSFVADSVLLSTRGRRRLLHSPQEASCSASLCAALASFGRLQPVPAGANHPVLWQSHLLAARSETPAPVPKLKPRNSGAGGEK